MTAVAQSSDVVLEEIIVTAQKVAQQYLEVPVAVSTVTGEVLDMAKVTQFQDLVQVSPSVTYNQTGDQRGVGVLVRGIGTTSFLTAVEPTVSTVVDGVTLGRTAQFISNLVDIERVEVLRGPQGTLFGKNASAGLINVITKRPSDEFEGSIRANVTDDDGWGIQAQVAGPLSDAVRGRISAFTKEFDGFINNTVNGDTLGGYESFGFRGKLEFDIGNSANLLLIGDYSEQDRDCCAFVPTDLGASPAYAFDFQGITVNEENVSAPIGIEPGDFSDTESSGLSAELTVEFENFVLTSITAYRGFTLESQQNVDMIPYTEPTYARLLFLSNGATNGGDQEQSQFSQELRIHTTASDTFNLTAGLFYWDQSVERYFERELAICAAPGFDPALSPDPADTPCLFGVTGFAFMNTDVDTENWALFGQADWRLADTWTATLGLRYTQDDLAYSIDRQSTGPAVPPPFQGSGQTDESNLSGKLALMWDVSDTTMLYGSYAEGYKAPAFDLVFGADAERLSNPVAPETSEAWEFGMKAEFDRLRLGLTAFHTTFKDLQGQGTIPGEIGFFLTSAGTALTQGLEFDFTAKPTANLLLNGGIAYIDATYDEYPSGPCHSGQTEAQGCVGGVQDLKGKDIPNSPDLKVAVQARYDAELNATVGLYVIAGYRWQDDTVANVNQDPRLDHVSYDIFDLTVGLESDDGRWTASIFAKNLFDNFYEDLRIESDVLSPGMVGHYLSRDAWRYIGAQFDYRFGAL